MLERNPWILVIAIFIPLFLLGMIVFGNLPNLLPFGRTSPEPSTVIVDGSPSPSPTPDVIPSSDMVKIFLIALGDEGKSGPKIGCGDSVVFANSQIPETTMPLTAAVNELLSQKSRFFGQSGLYNALYQSDLKLESAEVKNGVATVNLSGMLTLGGVCDNPRVEAQLTETVKQFPTVKEVKIFVNGKTLQEILSQR